MKRVVLIALALVAWPCSAFAQEEKEEEGVAMRAERGLHLGIGPTLLLPSRSDGPYGGGLELDGRYGIQAGPTVIAPGGMLGGYLISSRFIGVAMPTVRWALPVGPLSPYVLGGIGGGWLSNPSEGGLALMGGGGLVVHFGSVFSIGAEVTYRTISDTEYHGIAFGPTIGFGG